MIFHAYLTAYFFWLALALGCLGILMVHNLAGGYWGAVIRRPLEAAVTTLPLLALLFVPIVVGMPQLYPWLSGDVTASPQAGAEVGRVAEGAMLGFKQAYLSAPFFVGRAVFYFAVWIILALLLVRWSRRRDADPRPALTARLRNLSAPGLALLCADHHLRGHRLAHVARSRMDVEHLGADHRDRRAAERVRVRDAPRRAPVRPGSLCRSDVARAVQLARAACCSRS